MYRKSVLSLSLMILCCLLWEYAYSESDISLSLIKDAAGMFNERGYYKSNSISFEDDFAVNNYNGNLLYTIQLSHLETFQGNLHQDLKLVYNGSVGHTTASGHQRPNTTVGEVVSINLPEWILSFNDIAIQTFNFENEHVSWPPDTSAQHIAYTNDVSALVNGYHDCHIYKSTYEVTRYSVISILLGDGSVQQFIKLNPASGYSIYGFVQTGEYRTMSKDDRSKGYVTRAEDGTGYFIWFREDGIKITFLFHRPIWRTTITGPEAYQADSLLMLLPIKFEDQIGHELSLDYFTGSCEYGRPFIQIAGDYSFDWGGMPQGYQGFQMNILEKGDVKYRLFFNEPGQTPVSQCLDRNRAMITSVKDKMNREYNFDYRFYCRRGTDLDGWEFEYDNGPMKHSMDQFNILVPRLFSVTNPEGGLFFYSYYMDNQTAWPDEQSSEIGDDLSIQFDDYMCQGGNGKYPCQKSDLFDDLGRDPYFINMVSATRKALHSGDDTICIRVDSLSYYWIDSTKFDQISHNDVFYTERLSALDPEDYGGGQIKLTKYRYRNIPEQGVYSDYTRDRGWSVKLIYEGVYNGSAKDIAISSADYYWNLGAFQSDYYNGTLQLDRVEKTVDGISTTEEYSPVWVNAANYTESNILSNTTYDPWGNYRKIFYNSGYFLVSDPITNPDLYYTNSLIDSVRSFNSGDQLISLSRMEYYDGLTGPGYSGQLKTKAEFILGSGQIVDTIITHYEYVKGSALNNLEEGNLRKVITPTYDSIIYYYTEWTKNPTYLGDTSATDSSFCPVLFKELCQGDIIRMHLEQFINPAPLWYKCDYFKSNRTLTIDSIISIDTIPETLHHHISVISQYGEQTVKIDTILMPQIIPYELYVLPKYCYSGRADIYRNDILIDRANCEGPYLIRGEVAVSAGDRVKIIANRQGDDFGYSDAEFWYNECCNEIIDTIFLQLPDAISIYRQYNDDELLQRLVTPNGFSSSIDYDLIDRIKYVTLPGGYLDYASPLLQLQDTLFTVYATIDGENNRYLQEVANCLENIIWTKGREVDAEVNATFAFENIPFATFMGIDSAYLIISCADKSAEADIVQVGTHGDYLPICGHNMRNSLMYIGDRYRQMSLGANRINVTEIVEYWKNHMTGPVKPVIALVAPSIEADFAFRSMEYPDSLYRPRLIIYAKVNPNVEIYSQKYEYLDTPDDSDMVSTISYTRIDTIGSGASDYKSRVYFDGMGRTVKTSAYHSPDSSSSTKNYYDYNDRLATTKDQLGYCTDYNYDLIDRKTRITYPDTYYKTNQYMGAAANTFGLDTLFNMGHNGLWGTRYIDENDNIVNEYNDVRGKSRLRRTFPNDTTEYRTYFDYDELGNLITVIKPKGDSVKYRYNSMGWLLEERSADYDSIYYKYDKKGRVILKRDGYWRYNDVGNFKRWEYYEYDALDRVTAVGGCVYYNGNPIGGRVPIQRYFYDQNSSKYSKGKLSMSYIDINSYKYGERFDYDARGRIIKKVNYFGSSLDSTLLYSPDFYEYKLTGGDSSVYSYEYNLADNITKVVYPDGTSVNYYYDNLGRLKSVGYPSNQDYIAKYEYTPRNEISQAVFGDTAQIVDYKYNSRGWLTSINDTLSDTLTQADKYYQYLFYHTNQLGGQGYHNGNIAGQVADIDSYEISYVYNYDDLNRLSGSARIKPTPIVPEELFNYDANGNIGKYKYSRTIANYDQNYYDTSLVGNRLYKVTGTFPDTLDYDDNGNVTYDAALNAHYTYNWLNNMYSITFPPDTGSNYDALNNWYNPEGQRILKKYSWWNGGQQYNNYKRYHLSNGNVLMETNENGGNPVKYIYAGNERIAMFVGGTSGVAKYFYLKDHLGSTRVLIKIDGTIMAKYQRYRAFGTEDVSWASLNQAYRYTGKPVDEEKGIDQQYFGARYYQPSLGRWLAVDPLRNKYPDWSPYVYCADNPMGFTDPNGMWLENAHDRIIDLAFASVLSDHQIEILKTASRSIDNEQSPWVSYMHAMRYPRQSKESAEGMMNSFINGKIKDFVNGEGDEALFSLGEAMHALMDNTCPAHSGFKKWSVAPFGILSISDIAPAIMHYMVETLVLNKEAKLEETAKTLVEFYKKALKQRNVASKHSNNYSRTCFGRDGDYGAIMRSPSTRMVVTYEDDKQ